MPRKKANKMTSLVSSIVAIIASSGCGSLKNDRLEAGGGFLEPPKYRRIIVFIHGIFGDNVDTWRNKNGNEWPRLILEDMQGFDVYSVDFYSPFRGRAANIDEISTRVRSQLERRGVLEYSEIHIIAHSMGGLITKALLLDLALSSDGIPSQFKTITFLATPAQGASIADVGSWLSNNPHLRDMSAKDFNTFLTRVERQWQGVLRRRTPQRPWPRVYCAYEMQPVGGFVLVVPRLYTSTTCDEDPYPMDTLTHISISKPEDISSDLYTWVRHHIEQAATGPKVGMDPSRRKRLLEVARTSEDQPERERALKALYPEWEIDLGNDLMLVIFKTGEDAIYGDEEKVDRSIKFVEYLIELLDDASIPERIREECAHSLAKIGGEAAAKALLEVLKSRSTSAEIQAIALHGPSHFWSSGLKIEQFNSAAVKIIREWPGSVCREVIKTSHFKYCNEEFQTLVVLCAQTE